MTTQKTQSLTAILFDAGECWVGVILEHWLVTQAPTKDLLQAELPRFLNAHILISLDNGLVPFEGLPPAPAKYHRALGTVAATSITCTYSLPSPQPGLLPTQLVCHEVSLAA
jgi:hypothetical protein